MSEPYVEHFTGERPMNEQVLPRVPEHVREALQAILDYLADEKGDFETKAEQAAAISCPAPTGHIWLYVKAVGDWLDYRPGAKEEMRVSEKFGKFFRTSYGEIEGIGVAD
jgi:hypothetical protein